MLPLCQPLNTWYVTMTSKVWSSHSPKRKLWAGYRTPSLQRTSYLWVVLLCWASSIFHCRVWMHRRTLSLCYVRAMHVFDIWASSSAPTLPLCQILFLSCPPPIAELACRENHVLVLNHSITQSLTQLIWCAKNWYFRFGKFRVSFKRHVIKGGFLFNHFTPYKQTHVQQQSAYHDTGQWTKIVFIVAIITLSICRQALRNILGIVIWHNHQRAGSACTLADAVPVSYTHLTLPTKRIV